MDLFEATQVLRDETPSNISEDEVATLKIGSQTHIIRRGFNRIGRSPQCPVVINDVTVSKVHAEIQAGAEAAFVSDLRSSNGTKIKDVPIRPFYYYSINDGDAIYFGQVKAVYKTTGSTAIDDVLLVPETPVVSKNRNGPERFNTGAGNISESFLNDSSMYESDASMIPGTQDTERKRPTFQMPATPVPRSASNRTVEASNGVRSRDAVRKSDVDGTETRKDVDAALQPPGAKRPRLQRQNVPDIENNIHETETQSMPSSIANRKEPARSHQPDNIHEEESQAMPVTTPEKNNSQDRRNHDDIFDAETQALPEKMAEKNNSKKRSDRDDIFEAETQGLPVTLIEKNNSKERRNRDDIFEAETQDLAVTMSEKNNSKERRNRDDIFEAETQALPVTMSEKKKSLQRKSQDDIFEAETQALSVTMSNKNNSKEQKNREDIFEAETQGMEVTTSREPNSIFDAETQAMDVPKLPKSGEKIDERRRSNIFEAKAGTTSRTVDKREANSIHEAETQIVLVTSSESNEPIEVQENIHDLATQILDKNKSSNETVESTYRSSSSRDRLRLSSTPPSSPENVDIQESQNLLEIVETPLLAYDKNFEKISSREDVPGAAEKSKIGEKKSRVFRRVQTIPESSESETDDEKVPTRFVRKFKPSNVIEDSSEEPTDEENVFENFPIARRNNDGNVNDKKDVSLRTRKTDGTLPDEIEEQDSEKNKKKDVSMSEDSHTRLLRRTSGIEPTNINGSPPRGRYESDGSGDSPTGVSRRSGGLSSNKIGETSTGKSGRSSLPLLGRREHDSLKKSRENAPESAGVEANPFESSDSRGAVSPKKFESISKFGRSPLRLARKGNQESLEKNQQEASGKGARSNLFGDSPGKDNTIAAKKQGNAPEGSKNSTDNDLPINLKEVFEDSKDSRKIEDSPERMNMDEIKPDNSAKFQPRSNIFGRPSLRLSRTRDIRSPNKIAEKSAKEEENSIFEVATQRVAYDKVGNVAAPRKSDGCEASAVGVEEVDIDLLPTQILDVPSSTPISRKSGYRKNRAGAEQLDGDDLHTAPTQILKETPQRENTDANRENTKPGGKIDLDDSIAATLGNILGEEVNDDQQLHGEDLHGAPTRISRKSPRRGIADAGRKKAKNGGKAIDFDDSIATNLENLLGEEANNDHLDDESTQLMTQNLVDILRPTQTFNEDARKSSPRTPRNNFREDTSSPARKRIYAPGTLGFVDGEVRDSSKELVSAESSPIKPAKETKEIAGSSAKTVEPEASANLDDDDDDIFRGLPEVNLYSTLSYPGSPAPSSSSADDFPPPVRPTSIPSKKRPRALPTRKSSTTKGSDSPDRDSPITPKKSRVTKRSASSYKIIEDTLDDDSEEDFDYQELKRMADRLLASGSSTAEPGDDDKFTKIPLPAPKRPNVRKIVERKKTAAPKRRAIKLSGGSSSIVVSDVKTESSDSSGEPKKSTRRRKREPASSTAATIVKSSGGEESQEVEAILGNSVVESRPMVSRKSYVKIHMTRCDEVNEDDAVSDTPKAARTRRTVSTARKTPETPVTPARARRTIGAVPGIPGDVEDRKILFTGVNDDKYFKIVAKLGGTVVSDPAKATVLITDKVRRTFKFLCAVARGIRVVSINWLVESGKSSRFLDCEGFILKDPDAEAKYKFTLDKSLRIAKSKKLLDGYTIIVTPKVNQPEAHELKGMVEACGGRLLVRPGRNWTAKTVIISREEDYEVAKAYLAKAPKRLKITVQTTEFILTGILRQEINLVEHELNFE